MHVIERRNAEIDSCLDASEVKVLSALLDRLVDHARSTASHGAEPIEQGSRFVVRADEAGFAP